MSRLPYATPSDLGLDATGRPGYEISQESRFDDPDAKHHSACPCAECHVTKDRVAPLHLEVDGVRLSRHTACGEHWFNEAMGSSAAPKLTRAPGEVTCVKCLAVSRLRLVKGEEP